MKHKEWMIVAALCIVVCVALVAAVLTVTGGRTDVIADRAATSFNALLQAAPALMDGDPTNGWSLTSPDGGARFAWFGRDMSGNSAGMRIAFDAAPFVAAGLDLAALPATYTVADGWLGIGAAPAMGGGEPVPATPLEAYGRVIEGQPSLLGYHTPMDHFGVNLGNGNLFEWAQDLAVNVNTGAAQDKDAVFVLNPEPLIAAGADPQAVAGWAYAQVPVMENGGSTLVYKFLKPIDIQ
jgi:hypothetical protein